jgi:low density lipoprotein receptor-related protein 5/6
MDFDEAEKKIYWLDYGNPSITKMLRADRDGSNVEQIHAGPSLGSEPVGIDVDEVGRKLYWTDYRGGMLYRSELDGSDQVTLFSGLAAPQGVEVDPVDQKIYWSQNDGTIRRANIDGTGAEILLRGTIDPEDIALDRPGGKIYWTENVTDKIQRANFDGSDAEDVLSISTNNFYATIDIDSMDGKMYWTVPGTLGNVRDGKIQRANLDGTEVEDLITRIIFPVALALDLSLIVDIDIKPGGDPNSINPSLEGNFPVAILGSDTFDPEDVDVASLNFGPNSASIDHSHGPHSEDVDGDGLTDLMAHFRIEETGIEFGDAEACVTGETIDGIFFEGCDEIRTVPDMDGDKLLDVEEAAFGTDAMNPDTDGDGFEDGQEVLVMDTDPLNPLDPAPARKKKGRKSKRRR